MFTGVCGPPEKLSLALVPRSYVLRMSVKLAYTKLVEESVYYVWFVQIKLKEDRISQ